MPIHFPDSLHSHLPDMTDRARHLLNVLVDNYIQDGQPVGSKTLAKQSGLDLSAATVRNVMADLEEMGFLEAPHKSAGRVPTSLGYRFFVNNMVEAKPFDAQSVTDIATQFQSDRDTQSIIQSASTLLSGVTHLTGIISVPRQNQRSIKHIDFVPLSDSRVLVVLVMQHDEIQNRIIKLERSFSASELQQVSNILNESLVGRSLHEARGLLLDAMDKDRAAMNELMLTAIELGEKAVNADDEGYEDCVIAGKSNLMAYDDLSDISQLRKLFSAFNQKRDVLSLLDKCMHADGIQIFIGHESGYSAFDDCSVITAPYSTDDETLGVVGVIGPKRMHYERVIPAVDITAKLLSAALKK
jgi:heat-inducible transcriptional repressor